METLTGKKKKKLKEQSEGSPVFLCNSTMTWIHEFEFYQVIDIIEYN
jgi:hypothetical protein